MQEKFCELTDSQWEGIKEIVDNQRKIKHEKRLIFNAILWILTTGSQWRNMESKYPPWQYRSSLKAVVGCILSFQTVETKRCD